MRTVVLFENSSSEKNTNTTRRMRAPGPPPGVHRVAAQPKPVGRADRDAHHAPDAPSWHAARAERARAETHPSSGSARADAVVIREVRAFTCPEQHAGGRSSSGGVDGEGVAPNYSLPLSRPPRDRPSFVWADQSPEWDSAVFTEPGALYDWISPVATPEQGSSVSSRETPAAEEQPVEGSHERARGSGPSRGTQTRASDGGDHRREEKASGRSSDESEKGSWPAVASSKCSTLSEEEQFPDGPRQLTRRQGQSSEALPCPRRHGRQEGEQDLSAQPDVDVGDMLLGGLAQPEMFPQDDETELSSIGSTAHAAGRCVPCLFWFQHTCSKGALCTYCHVFHPGQKKKRIRMSKKVRLELKAMNAGGSPTGSGSSGLAQRYGDWAALQDKPVFGSYPLLPQEESIPSS